MSHADRFSSNVCLSVVVPCFNEDAVLDETHRRLTTVLEELDVRYELIYVDDGSSDGTAELLHRLQLADPAVRVLRFSRNFGHQTAVTAGIDHAAGDAVVLIDADLQDPPEVIVDMLAKWRDGYEVVYGRRSDRQGESRFKLWTAKLFYRLINGISDVPIPLDTGDFRLMDRKVVDALKRMPERDRFVRGMVSWVGFRQAAVPYRRSPRFAGVSKYPLRKMVRFACDGILSFSIAPLQFAWTIGIAACVLALLGSLAGLASRMFASQWMSGWAWLLFAMLFMGGVQLVTLGIIGEYVGRLYRESKRRPLYLLDEQIGFESVASRTGSRAEVSLAGSSR